MKNFKKNSALSVILWKENFGFEYYKVSNLKGELNIASSNSYEVTESFSEFDDSFQLAKFYRENIKNFSLPVIFVGYFQSAINATIKLSIKDKLTNAQLSNLIKFELQKHVPVDVELLKIIYYYPTKNGENEKTEIQVFCCLKTEWDKFEEYCLDNNLKFDCIYLIDSHKQHLAIDVEVLKLLENAFFTANNNNLFEVVKNSMRIYRHTVAKKTFLILMTLILGINGYMFFSSWKVKHTKYTDNQNKINKLTKQLKNIQNNNRKNKTYFKKITELLKLQKGVSRVDLIMKHLIEKLPSNCVVTSFSLNNKALTLKVISPREQNRLLERLEKGHFMKAINNTDHFRPLGIKEFTLNFEINEAVFKKGGQ